MFTEYNNITHVNKTTSTESNTVNNINQIF